MGRNLVLTISSALVLVLLFIGYTLIVRDPQIDDSRHRAIIDTVSLPPDATQNVLKFGPDGEIVIPPGEGAGLTRFDPKTRRATHRVSWSTWRPVPSSKKDMHLTDPRLAIRLPRDQVAIITADEGQVSVDRLEKSRAGWSHGWLRGNVKIDIDLTAGERAEAAFTATQPANGTRQPADATRQPTSRAAAAAPRVTIRMDELSFDLELGKLKTDGPLAVAGPDFLIEGTGLDMTWNQAADRVDELHIPVGKRLVLENVGDFLGLTAATESSDEATPNQNPARQSGAIADRASPASTRPARTAAQPDAGGARPDEGAAAQPDRMVSYLCTLAGDVTAQRYDAEGKLADALQARGLRLLFDLGRSAGLADRSATSRPAAASRLEVTWSGPLSLVPTTPPAPPMKWGRPRGQPLPAPTPRRRLEAIGPDVLLTRGGSSIHCGGLEFNDDTHQIWLHRGEHANVRMRLDEGSWATAAAIYVDRSANAVKLVGDVYLESRRGTAALPGGGAASSRPAAEDRVTTIACSQVAELFLDAAPRSGAASPDELTSELDTLSRSLRSATFHGDVRAGLADRELTALRLDVSFRDLAGAQTFDALLEQAVATGAVRFVHGADTVEAGRLVVDFGVAADGKSFVSGIDATGGVRMTRADAWLRGRRVVALLDRPELGKDAQRRQEFSIRTLDVYGDAALLSPKDRVGARGEHVAAWFAGDNAFERARVDAAAGAIALVHAAPYTVRGPRIDIDAAKLTLDVEGASRLAFLTDRGLWGARGTPSKVLVTSQRRLHVDGRENRIDVEGDVFVTRENELLRGDTLTLLLADAPHTEPSPPAEVHLGRFVDAFKASLLGRPLEGGTGAGRGSPRNADDRPGDDLFIRGDVDLGRKDPVRLIATNALVQMQLIDPTVGKPIVDRSLTAPRLEVDILARTTYTTGETTLLVQDYRVDPAVAPPTTGGAAMVPSDLVSGGPMQTVIRCDNRLTYALAAPPPAGAGHPPFTPARDSVLLEGGVRLVHLTGRAILDFSENPWMTRLDAAALQKLKERNTSLDCDRLECEFGREADAAAARRADAAGSVAPSLMDATPGARLMWLLASGNVVLDDKQGPTTTEVYAERITFDRAGALLSVFGSSAADARVYRWTGERSFSTPYTGPEFHLDLRNNTIRGRGSGEIRP